MTYTPPPFPAGLTPGGRTPSARGLQKALKDAGYLSKLVLYSDNYGTLTQSAVKRFHAANPAYGRSTDGAIGPKGWAALHRETYAPAVPVPSADAEPAHNYIRTTYGTKTVNSRTKVLLERAAVKYGQGFYLTQGSYNRGVGASAGTHDGGGVVDISVSGMSNVQRSAAVNALRQAGFAAWLRTPVEGFAYHIHACAIGDREMAWGARSQVTAYFNGRNGLAGNGPDTASVGRPYPSWAVKYK